MVILSSMKKRLFALLIVSLSIVTLYAQDITFEVQYPSVVRVGQQFNVTWVVNVSGGDFESLLLLMVLANLPGHRLLIVLVPRLSMER